MICMRDPPPALLPAVATLACLLAAGCTASHGAPRSVASAPAASPGSGARATALPGSPGNPLRLSCAQESFGGLPVPQRPGRGDLPLGRSSYIPGGRWLATADPAGRGEHGRYKVPLVVTMGSTVTVTIAPPARGRVLIDNPYSPARGVTSATYHSCARQPGFYAQGFVFTHGQARGCVPLDISGGHRARMTVITLSLFAGRCPA
jgi:hypothetical protein